MAATLEVPDAATADSVARLTGEIDRFLDNIAGSGEDTAGTRAQLDRLVNLRARTEVLRLLHDTVFQLGLTRNGMPPGEAAALGDALTQGLGAVLMCADDAARDGDAETVDMLKRISSDRSAAVDAMRRRLVKATNQEAVYRLTSLFERAVWLVQRYALLLPIGGTGVIRPGCPGRNVLLKRPGPGAAYRTTRLPIGMISPWTCKSLRWRRMRSRWSSRAASISIGSAKVDLPFNAVAGANRHVLVDMSATRLSPRSASAP